MKRVYGKKTKSWEDTGGTPIGELKIDNTYSDDWSQLPCFWESMSTRESAFPSRLRD
jgi:hypothetical protein